MESRKGKISNRFVGVALLLACLIMPAFGQYAVNKNRVSTTIEIIRTYNNANYILYDASKLLEISDFRGKPNGRSAAVGATYSGIELSWESKSYNGKVEAKIKMLVYFDKSQSWMKPAGKTERVLKHEQVHFDLTALKACALYHAIEKENFTPENLKARVRALQDKYVSELQEEQSRYDEETQHGTIAEKQQEWAERVAKAKAKLDCM